MSAGINYDKEIAAAGAKIDDLCRARYELLKKAGTLTPVIKTILDYKIQLEKIRSEKK